jgi:hypothetical protein
MDLLVAVEASILNLLTIEVARAVSGEWAGRTFAIEGTIGLGFGIAFLTFFGLIWRQLVKPIRDWVENINTIVDRELQVNGGASMKDTVNFLQIQEEHAHRDRVLLQKTLDDHIANADMHHLLQQVEGHEGREHGH